jgi:hypothetical protein
VFLLGSRRDAERDGFDFLIEVLDEGTIRVCWIHSSLSALSAYGSVVQAALQPFNSFELPAGIPNLDQTDVANFHLHRDASSEYFEEKTRPTSYIFAILCPHP